jgi:hypothetical protein
MSMLQIKVSNSHTVYAFYTRLFLIPLHIIDVVTNQRKDKLR